MKKIIFLLTIMLMGSFGTKISAQDTLFNGLSEIENVSIVTLPGLVPGQRCFFGPNVVMTMGYIPGVESILMAYVDGNSPAMEQCAASYISQYQLLDLSKIQKGNTEWGFSGTPIQDVPGYYSTLVITGKTPDLTLTIRLTGMVSLAYFKSLYHLY